MDIYLHKSKVKSLKNTYLSKYSIMYTIYFCRREAIHVPFSRVPVAICPFRRVDAALSQTHRRQAIQMQSLRALFRALGSFGPSYEETFTKGTKATPRIFRVNFNKFNSSRVTLSFCSYFFTNRWRYVAKEQISNEN